MSRQRIKIEVEVSVDPVPDWGTRPADLVTTIQRVLDRTIPHYNPVVTYVAKVEKTSDVPA